jgi:hypothetical protein
VRATPENGHAENDREESMSRRDQWKEAASKVVGESKPKTFEERERVPEKACGLCKNFSENAYASDGRGTCAVLRGGSEIEANPPTYVMEGVAPMIILFNTDGGACRYFEKMAMIDKDGSECADPAFRRMQRQMEKVVG